MDLHHGSDISEAFPSYVAHVQTRGCTSANDSLYSRKCLMKMEVDAKTY